MKSRVKKNIEFATILNFYLNLFFNFTFHPKMCKLLQNWNSQLSAKYVLVCFFPVYSYCTTPIRCKTSRRFLIAPIHCYSELNKVTKQRINLINGIKSLTWILTFNCKLKSKCKHLKWGFFLMGHCLFKKFNRLTPRYGVFTCKCNVNKIR